jgi:hypothetical protein
MPFLVHLAAILNVTTLLWIVLLAYLLTLCATVAQSTQDP